MHYHIVGIAGAGMSALAHLLLDQGHTVSGSDLVANTLTATLSARGAKLHVGHDPAYVQGADALLATAAVKPEHPELIAARATDIPVLKRDDLWSAWSQQRTIIAVAGTHGKTTTTAMLAWLFTAAGRNPGFLIGSESNNLGTNARWGDPVAPLIIEADEYDRAFLALGPNISVITNVEWDHPDIYPTAEAYYQAFEQFGFETEGVILTGDRHIDNWIARSRAASVPLITYGLEDDRDYQAVLMDAHQQEAGAVEQQLNTTMFRVRRSKRVSSLVHINDSSDHVSPDERWYSVGVPGVHNMCNALAVIAVADLFGLTPQVVTEALRSFRSTARRFELKGEANGITVVDDYGHHPTEVRATLAAARMHYGQRRIVAYLQPHTYSRTLVLLDAWPAAFADADVVLVGAIYASRELNVDGQYDNLVVLLTEKIAAIHPEVSYVGTVAEATTHVQHVLQPGDVLVTLGAGDGNLVGEAVLAALSR